MHWEYNGNSFWWSRSHVFMHKGCKMEFNLKRCSYYYVSVCVCASHQIAAYKTTCDWYFLRRRPNPQSMRLFQHAKYKHNFGVWIRYHVTQNAWDDMLGVKEEKLLNTSFWNSIHFILIWQRRDNMICECDKFYITFGN